jgi:hypothetical protein
MGTTFKYAPKQRSGEISEGPSVDEEPPGHAVAAEDVFDDPSILRELDEATASLAVRRDAEPASRLPARLPPVDAFDFEAACRVEDFEGFHEANDFEEAHRAKSLAHRLGPPAPDLGPKRRWWRFAIARKPLEDQGDAGWLPPPYGRAPRSGRRAAFWGVCASLAIIIAAPIVFGNFRPLNEPLPAAVGEIADNDEVNAGFVDQVGEHEPAVANEAATDPQSTKTVVIRNHPAVAAIIAPATTAFAAPLIRSTANEIGPDVDEGFELFAAEPDTVAGLKVTNPDSSVPALQPIDTDQPVSPPPKPTANPDNEDFTQMAQSRLSARADPSQTEVLEKTPGESIAAFSEPGSSPLSGAQIDRLLSRGEGLLRSGDIASARLLFLHVAAAGDRRGAKAVGMTFDPKIYAHLPVMGLTPDIEQAQLWYGKAGSDLSYTIDLTSPAIAAQAAESPEEDALRQWNAACARKYLSFDPSTGLYTGRSGTKRRCQLP